MLPNFIIVGAMKAGTTTLRDYLSTVEDVWILPGEARFFSIDANYARGVDWYSTLFKEAAGKPAIGEKSPAYCYQPYVAGRIRGALADVKLVWVFREPVARAYSHYWHAAARGNERFSFEEAIARENDRIRRDLLRGYLKRSRYAEQVETYLQHFPRPQMHFLLFEDLLKNPAAVVNDLLAFLGLARKYDHKVALSHSNETRAPRSVQLQWLGRTVLGRGPAYRVIRRWNERKEKGYPHLRQDLRERLMQEFEEPNARLAALTDLDLSPWKAGRSGAHFGAHTHG